MGELIHIPKGYKRTKIGVIPEDWTTNTVGKALVIENNKRKPISELERREIQGVYPYYGPTKIQDYLNEYHYDGEYALIAEDGDHFLKYRDHSMTQLVSGKFNVNNHAHALKGTDECLTKWFFWFYNRRSVYSHITRQGAGRYKLNKSALEQLHIVYPEIPEQTKIIETLDTWDKAISTTQSIIDELNLRNKGLAQQLLTGKKRLKGFDQDWSEVHLGDLIEICSSKRVLQKDWKTEGIPFLRTREVISLSNEEEFRTPIYISEDLYKKLKQKYGVPKRGDILTTGVGTIGETYIITSDDKFYFKDGNVLWFKMNNRIDSTFLHHQFQTTFIRKQLFDNASITTVATFTINGARRTKIKIPQLEEQQKIAEVISVAEKETRLLKNKLIALKEQKKGLMQKLLTGEIRVKVD